MSDLIDRPVERRLIGLRWLRCPRYLPHILQSGVMHLSLSRVRFKVVQGADISTHRSIVHEAIQDALRQAQGTLLDRPRAQLHCSDGDGMSPSVGYRRAADGRSDERTRFRSRRVTAAAPPAPMREETRPEKSVRVISAVELVEQTGQGDEAEGKTNDHEPPSVDGSQHDGHECE